MHATTLPLSLLILSQTPHCILPIMPVLHWCVPRTFQPGLMFTHCPAGLNRGHCLALSLTRSRCISWYPVHQTHTHSYADTHTQGPFSTGTLGRGCHGDNRPILLHPKPPPSPPNLHHPSLTERKREREIKKWYYSKCGMCERECAFPSYSWHSQRRRRGPVRLEDRWARGMIHTHNRFTHSL